MSLGKLSIFKSSWLEARGVKKELELYGISFQIRSRDGMIEFIFGDLPVRQFGKVWGLFGEQKFIKG